MTGNNHEEKAKKTQETISVHRLLVRCNQCGSTAVGLAKKNDKKQLVCDSCGNNMPWDAEKFTLIKEDAHQRLETTAEIQKAVQDTEERAEERS